MNDGLTPCDIAVGTESAVLIAEEYALFIGHLDSVICPVINSEIGESIARHIRDILENAEAAAGIGGGSCGICGDRKETAQHQQQSKYSESFFHIETSEGYKSVSSKIITGYIMFCNSFYDAFSLIIR